MDTIALPGFDSEIAEHMFDINPSGNTVED